MVALPVLFALGTAIGNSRVVIVKKGWSESPALYCALIADTGSMKSAVVAKAVHPITQIEGRRTWTVDTTTEKLADLLQKSSHGIGIVRDELLGWVRSCNQYRDGKGADRDFYLSAWSGSDLVVDRKHSPEPVIVKDPFLSVCGGLPPDRLAELEGGRGEDGFLERFLFAWPEPHEIRWTEIELSDETVRAYESLVANLYELGLQSHREPLGVTPQACRGFASWHNKHFEELHDKGKTHLRGFYSKLKGYCARLALIHAVSTNPEADSVGEESVQAAIEQTEYFKAQANKVKTRLESHVGVGTVGRRISQVDACREAINRAIATGKYTTRREVQKNLNYDGPVFREAWDSLMAPSRIVSRKGRILTLEPCRCGEFEQRGTDTPTTDNGGDEPPDLAA